MSQTTDTPAPAPAPAPTPGKNRRSFLLRGLLAVIVLAAIAWTLWYFLEGRWYATTDDAYVHGNVVQITPRTAGTVLSIGAEDGDLVHTGQVLVRLDPADADVALQGAEADLARTVRKVRALYRSVKGQQAELAARRIALDKARADYRRRQGLVRDGAVSIETLAHARDTLAAAESALAAAMQHYRSGKVQVDDTVIATHPDVLAAAARVRAAYLQKVRTTLVAPVTGYVAQRTVQVGQRVQPGEPLMAVVPLGQVWVDANFKETQLGNMRIGQPVTLTSDLYGSSVTFHGTVQSLGIGTGSAFALLPAQNATGNWIKIVQRVPVRIRLDPADIKAHPLRIGLSMNASVNLHHRSGPVLAQKAPTGPVFTTEVYRHQLRDADALIARIIKHNSGHPKQP